MRRLSTAVLLLVTGVLSAPSVGATEPQAPKAQKQAAPAPAVKKEQGADVEKKQTPAPPEPTQAAQSPKGNIEEIIVTAQKREQNLQDIPISMTALSGDDVSFRQIQGLGDLQYNVPSLTYGEREGGASVTIRGVGLNVNFGPFEGGVATHIDGHYQPTITSGILGLNDLDRVEVLRGPQGTLYGRNATGGAINFILKKPTDTFEGAVRVGYASLDTRNVYGYVSGPVIKGLLNARLSLEYDDADGFIKNLTMNRKIGGHEGYGGRLALAFHPLENLTFDVSLITRKEHLHPVVVMVTAPNPVLEAQLAIIPPSNSSNYVLWGDRRDQVREQRHGVGHKETTDLTNTVTWDTNYATVKSVTGFQYHYLDFHYDNDAEDRPTFFLNPNLERSLSMSQELNISHSQDLWWGTKLDWLAGAFYFGQIYDTFIDVDIDDALNGVGLVVYAKAREHVSAYAGFGDVTFSLTKWLRLYGGLRLSFEDKNVVQSLRVLVGPPGPARIPLPAPLPIPIDIGVHTCQGLHLRTSFNNLSPRYGIQLDATESIMVYGQRSLAFKAGGANPFVCNNIYKPEDVDSWEAGIKSRWFGDRLTANLSVFTNAYTNFQVAKTTGLEGPVVNAPKASIDGMELELHTRPFADLSRRLASLSFDVAFSYLNARYREFDDVDPANPGLPGMPFVQNLAGHHMNRAPDHTLNIGAEYSWPIPLPQLGPLRIRGDYFLTDKVYFRPYGGLDDRQAGYSIWNAFVSATNSSANIELRIFGKNLADKRYLTNISATQIGTHYGEPGLPRIIGTQLTYRW